MGLAIAVFDLAEILADEEIESYEIEDVKEVFAQLNRFLVRRNLPEHIEPVLLPDEVDYRGEIEGFPYSRIHFLRRAYVYTTQGLDLPPCESVNAADDPILRTEYESPQIDSHLVHFSDCEGFYVPMDFAKPLSADWEDEVLGGAVGSSPGLLHELIEIAPVIGIHLEQEELSDEMAAELADYDKEKQHPYATERMVWFTLYEAAQKSIKYGTAIRFG